MQLHGFREIRRLFNKRAGHLRATNWFTFEHPGLPLGLSACGARRARRRRLWAVPASICRSSSGRLTVLVAGPSQPDSFEGVTSRVPQRVDALRGRGCRCAGLAPSRAIQRI
ncbi:hypothetical protein BN381_150144 [Candidatus Microthrix parvicella RN1]|uniref:Uncharacterized protein n=1 Tax=Candidatus Neomicrothrix parvicella RN1 TaxID=1229780 RepID=R4Z165_9ACTN|nr:hypothetical protein BN381_150144 [Candidatus Microthrix parvicella RN1]